MLQFMLVLITQQCAYGYSELQASEVSDGASRSTLALNGLFNYFWKNDPNNKNVEFLFACGQLGEMGTGSPGKCSCYSPTSCVNCYRWWTAVMMESVATYGIYMNTTNHSSMPATVFKHSPYNSNWEPTTVSTCTYIDDFLWYGIAYLRVYDWLKVRSIQGRKSLCGGGV